MGKQLKMYLISLFILGLASFISGCAFWAGLWQPDIPEDALVGLQPGTSHILGRFRFADWAGNVPPAMVAVVFDGLLQDSGARDIRIFLSDGKNTQYVGALTEQLGLPGVKTIFINFEGNHCLIGYVLPGVSGNLLYFRIERPQDDPSRWMDAVSESKIENNLFLVPLGGSEHAQLWNKLVLSAVQTRESLQRGFDQKGSYFELEKAYAPPLIVSDLYVFVSLPK